MLNHGRFQPLIAVPTCDHCRKPKMVCYSNPCDGVLNHVADILLRAELQQPDRTPRQRVWRMTPLIKGGQGRRRDEVEAYANTVCILGLACIVVGVLLYVGMR